MGKSAKVTRMKSYVQVKKQGKETTSQSAEDLGKKASLKLKKEIQKKNNKLKKVVQKAVNAEKRKKETQMQE